MNSKILIGTAGWSYPDWKGIVYPSPQPSGFHPLRLLSRLFDLVEVNSSFYRIPNPRHVERWAELVSDHPSFRFTFKMWSGFTHEIKRERPTRGHVRSFLEGVRPVSESGQLAGFLVQFPAYYDARPIHRDHVSKFPDHFHPVPLFLEVRHRSWLDHLDRLDHMGWHMANIDHPPSPTSMVGTALSLNGAAYVRLHGRNSKQWFSRQASRDEKYDYLYEPNELSPWIERIERLQSTNDSIFVVTNNHFRGQAVVNALELRKSLGKPPITDLPAELLQNYPRLKHL
ncbi:MAG: DUF72 domain-containing protein [Planctomycetota bacterium]|nr:DUF72 domain-containing protein [Planctomycetota bacterium]